MLLADLGHYAAERKPPELRTTALIDEFGAVEGARDRAVDLAERGRDPGLAVVFSSQTLAGLGAPADQQRLLGAASGGIIAHRTIDADPIVQLGGAVKRTELTWQLGRYGPTDEGSARRAYSARVDPDVLRNLEPGEAVIVEAGRQQLVNVAQVRHDREAVAALKTTLSRWRWERELAPRAKYDEIEPRTDGGGSQLSPRPPGGAGPFDGEGPP
jgi:hypothetical protein